MAGIKEDPWFKLGYTPAEPEDEEDDVYIDDEAFSIHESVYFVTSTSLSSVLLGAISFHPSLFYML